jgi:hypothetical protein
MKRFLSIDWDYFINATADQRFNLFPDGGNENLPREIQDFLWINRYTPLPGDSALEVVEQFKESVSAIGAIDLTEIKEIIEGAKKRIDSFRIAFGLKLEWRSIVADSHKNMYDFVMSNTYREEDFAVYNVDFHHDLFNYRTAKEKVNCGNWGTELKNERPNMQFYWTKREDSDTRVIGDIEVECGYRTMKELKEIKFDYVYLCRSSMWSPPHLDKEFNNLARLVLSIPNSISIEGVMNERFNFDIDGKIC